MSTEPFLQKLKDAIVLLCELSADEIDHCVEIQHVPRKEGYSKYAGWMPATPELISDPNACAELVSSTFVNKLGCDLATLRSISLGRSGDGSTFPENLGPLGFFAVWLKKTS